MEPRGEFFVAERLDLAGVKGGEVGAGDTADLNRGDEFFRSSGARTEDVDDRGAFVLAEEF